MPEPVSLAEARAQVNIIDDADTTYDDFLTDQIAPARAYVEQESRFNFVAETRTETFGAWGDGCDSHWSRAWHSRNQFIEIYRRPIASVDHVYYGPLGTNSDPEYTGFVAPVGRFPLRIYPAADASFPALNRGEVVTVSYTSGAVASGTKEYDLGKKAILLLIGHWFANRDAVIAGDRAVSVEVHLAVADLIEAMGAPVSAY